MHLPPSNLLSGQDQSWALQESIFFFSLDKNTFLFQLQDRYWLHPFQRKGLLTSSVLLVINLSSSMDWMIEACMGDNLVGVPSDTVDSIFISFELAPWLFGRAQLLSDFSFFDWARREACLANLVLKIPFFLFLILDRFVKGGKWLSCKLIRIVPS